MILRDERQRLRSGGDRSCQATLRISCGWRARSFRILRSARGSTSAGRCGLRGTWSVFLGHLQIGTAIGPAPRRARAL